MTQFRPDLGALARLRPGVQRRRASTWDRTGGNNDSVFIPPGGRATIAEDTGPGQVTHLWFTVLSPDLWWGRALVLRAWWDGEGSPSVEVPLGDFLGAGNCIATEFSSACLEIAPRSGGSLHSWFPMPFSDGFRLEIENQSGLPVLGLYAYVDHEIWPEPDPELGRFHAWWNRRRGPRIEGPGTYAPGINLTGNDNYVFLDARGRGNFVGVSLYVHSDDGGWYGEGDDMIFIDSDAWPPTLHGTGTEDYFGTAWGPAEPFSFPRFGQPLAERADWAGFSSLYRFHIDDPIPFERSLRATIEQGHANDRADDYSSVAYWYQADREEPLPALQDVAFRRPPWPEASARRADAVREVFSAAFADPEVLGNPAETGRYAAAAGHIARLAFHRDWAAIDDACRWLARDRARPSPPPAPEMTLADAFATWVAGFDRETAGNARLTVGFRIEMPDGVSAWELRIADGTCSAVPEESERRRAVLVTDLAGFTRLTLGEADLWEEVLSGRLAVEGDTSVVFRLVALFPMIGRIPPS